MLAIAPPRPFQEPDLFPCPSASFNRTFAPSDPSKSLHDVPYERSPPPTRSAFTEAPSSSLRQRTIQRDVAIRRGLTVAAAAWRSRRARPPAPPARASPPWCRSPSGRGPPAAPARARGARPAAPRGARPPSRGAASPSETSRRRRAGAAELVQPGAVQPRGVGLGRCARLAAARRLFHARRVRARVGARRELVQPPNLQPPNLPLSVAQSKQKQKRCRWPGRWPSCCHHCAAHHVGGAPRSWHG